MRFPVYVLHCKGCPARIEGDNGDCAFRVEGGTSGIDDYEACLSPAVCSLCGRYHDDSVSCEDAADRANLKVA